jgi:long-chain acyl-CoA synthetase
MRRDTLLDVFHDLVENHEEFLVYDDGYRRRDYSYTDVKRAARGFAARMAETGLHRSDKVIFWGENRPEWLACYWGCVISGIVVIPIDYRSSPVFVSTVRKLVDESLLLTGNEVPTNSTELDLSAASTWAFSDLDWNADGPMPDVQLTRDDIVQVNFTSGATAEPKGVIIRHRNILANMVPVEREIAKYRLYARLFHPLRFLNLLPLSHLFGQSMAINIPPMLNGTVIFSHRFHPYEIVQLVKKQRVSVLVSVPKILSVLRDHVKRAFPESAEPPPPGASVLTRWWRYRRIHAAFGPKFWAFVVGGAPLPDNLEEFWRRMGFVVIQGYGLTETAPVVTLNHPFKTNRGSVGTPIDGVEVQIAGDGEIFVRGENVSSGYYGQTETAFDAEGWLHTGDIGERDEQGRLFIKGRKKEIIVTPEGLNVFPEDVERVLNALPSVRESAIVPIVDGGEERVHAVVVLEPSADLDESIRAANRNLSDHQRIRTSSVWPGQELPRTEGTYKLKRNTVRKWVVSAGPPSIDPGGDEIEALLGRFGRGHDVTDATTMEELGLSSLERIELMVALEDQFKTPIDETRFAEAASVRDLRTLVEIAPSTLIVDEPVDFPAWNRTWPVRILRRLSYATWILPLTKIFTWPRVEGLEHLAALDGPVVFAANHQSHLDVPLILSVMPGRLRARVAPAMAKEFFHAHFFPKSHTWLEWLTNTVHYYLAASYFNAFPLPQREAGARQTLRYIGELSGQGWSVLIFPEGARGVTGAIRPFQGGIGMIGARLDLPVVPIRLDGVDRILPIDARMAKPGYVRVAFGAPMHLSGDNYGALAAAVETRIRSL